MTIMTIIITFTIIMFSQNSVCFWIWKIESILTLDVNQTLTQFQTLVSIQIPTPFFTNRIPYCKLITISTSKLTLLPTHKLLVIPTILSSISIMLPTLKQSDIKYIIQITFPTNPKILPTSKPSDV